VAPNDPTTFIGVAVTMAAIGIVALDPAPCGTDRSGNRDALDVRTGGRWKR
jgi:hypothetical protein